MKQRRLLITVLLLSVAFLFSCNSGDEPHTCSYDSVTLACSCGSIKDGVVAYIGSSYENATARFVTLQDAANYSAQLYATKAPYTTIKGKPGVAITCNGLSITDNDVAFSLSSNAVTFSENSGISVSSSKVDSKVVFDAKSISCGIALTGKSELEIKSSNITINDFSADSSAKITLDSTNPVTVMKKADAEELKTFIPQGNFDVDESYVAYTGTSYSSATKRFTSLQSAADYIKNNQTDKNSAAMTVKGRSTVDISDSTLSIANSNAIFDLSSSTFKKDSQPLAISVSDSKFALKANGFAVKITLDDSSIFSVTSGNITINDFTAKKGSTISFGTSCTVTAADASVAKKMRDYMSSKSYDFAFADGHAHDFTIYYNDGKTKFWTVCDDCGYKTEEKDVYEKWVSMFYLDFANLDALSDIEEIIKLCTVPKNVTIYIITGGGESSGSEALDRLSSTYNPFMTTKYPYLVQALKNAGYSYFNQVTFVDSAKEDTYQYWKYYLDSNGKGVFKEIKRTPVNPNLKLMSDGWVLREFIDYVYSQENKDGTKYILHLWNHGGGNMWGMLQDCSASTYPVMSMEDMDTQVSASKFVTDKNVFEIILFDMCEMQQIETLNMVKDYAKCMIGSENTTITSRLGSLYQYVNENPKEGYSNIAKHFVTETNKKQTVTDYNYQNSTWSAFDLTDSAKINALNTAFNNFAGAVLRASDVKTKFNAALSSSVDYYSSSNHDTCSYDIVDVASKYGYSGVKTLEDAVAAIRIINMYGSNVKNSTGLAFFFDTNLKSNITKKYTTTKYTEYINRADKLYKNFADLTKLYASD